MILNDIKDIRVGSKQTIKIYKGSKILWTKTNQGIILPTEGNGDYLNPYKWKAGMTVVSGKWYYYNDIDLPQEAIKDGVAKGFDDTEYFDIFW